MSDVKHDFHMNGEDLIVTHSQDVSKYIDRNKARFNETRSEERRVGKECRDRW